MIENSKVRSSHTRRAVVYVRQSPAQVAHNRESTARQYHWPTAPCDGLGTRQVTIVDEDLGVSGSGLASVPASRA